MAYIRPFHYFISILKSFLEADATEQPYARTVFTPTVGEGRGGLRSKADWKLGERNTISYSRATAEYATSQLATAELVS